MEKKNSLHINYRFSDFIFKKKKKEAIVVKENFRKGEQIVKFRSILIKV